MQLRLVVSACIAALVAASPLAFAQADKPAEKKATSAKPASKPKLARSAQKAVEEVTPIDDDPKVQLSDADLEVAKQVHVGDIPCELGATVKVAPARRTGLFLVTTKGYRFLMHPVESRTGAIRLEDAKRGAMWLQLGNKSMLMSQKLGQRLADECQSPQQLTFAAELKRNPRPSILDAPKPVQEAAGPGTAASAAAAAQPGVVPSEQAAGSTAAQPKTN
jgi:Ni/Co efflux regulator RcnB